MWEFWIEGVERGSVGGRGVNRLVFWGAQGTRGLLNRVWGSAEDKGVID